MKTLSPRLVMFQGNKAVTAGVNCHCYQGPQYSSKVIMLPSEHYDFIDFDVRDKTQDEIEVEVRAIMSMQEA